MGWQWVIIIQNNPEISGLWAQSDVITSDIQSLPWVKLHSWLRVQSELKKLGFISCGSIAPHSISMLMTHSCIWPARNLNAPVSTKPLSIGLRHTYINAFDLLDHSILLHHLEHRLGITGPVLNWFKSYLSETGQNVDINSPQHIKWLVVSPRAQF